MRVLILTQTIGGGATGIVSKNLIEGMRLQGIKTYVFFEKSFNKDFENSSQEEKVSYKKIKNKSFYSELAILIFRYPLNEVAYVKKAVLKASKLHQTEPFDVVMVLSSANGLHLLEAGKRIAKKNKILFYIHATDPIPAPKEWYNTQSLRKALIRTAKKNYRKANIISLSNKHMLEYQKNIMGLTSTPSFVAHNPTSNNWVNKKEKKEKIDVFLYVGSIYHQRQPDFLIENFIEYAKINRNAVLRFLGKNEKLKLDKYNFEKEIKKKIELLGFVEDPSKIIEDADVLIDFDANFSNDVFISSKLITYLNTDLPILSLTPKNSPSDNLLSNEIQLGVTKMYYDHQKQFKAFDRVLKLKGNLDVKVINNRQKLLNNFDKIEVGKVIYSNLKNEL